MVTRALARFIPLLSTHWRKDRSSQQQVMKCKVTNRCFGSRRSTIQVCTFRLCKNKSEVGDLPSKQAVAGSSPVSRSFLETVPLDGPGKPPEGKQAVRPFRGDGFFM